MQYIDDLIGGVWLVFQYNKSMRLRFSSLDPENVVASAVCFDLVNE